jgi:alpha-beta hydrolase superfamily lysophospholipase
MAAVVWAEPFAGDWVGGVRERIGWTHIQIRIRGESADDAGRADATSTGDQATLLRDVRVKNDRISFQLPHREGWLFEGKVQSAGRITGFARQGTTRTRVELLQTRSISEHERSLLVGTFQGAIANDVILVHSGQNGLLYVDYLTGRVGRLFWLVNGTFVAGPSMMSGFPVELIVTFTRDVTGRADGLSWERRGEPKRHGRRRSLYRADPVQIRTTGGVVLACSLLLPNGRGPYPAAVIVPGSGRVTSRILVPFADSFARHGVAVLTCDRRGVGRSSGLYARAGISDLADDALAGVAWLRAHPAINGKQIGLVGASLGGWVVPLAASRDPDVAFAIIESAPVVTPAEHERMRVHNQMRADGRSREAVAQASHFMDVKLEVARTGEGWTGLMELAEGGERAGWSHYVNRPVSLESLRWNWEHVLSYDPRPVLQRLRIPLLALYGRLDRVVEPEFSKERIEEALRAAGNPDVTVRILPRANHHFFAAGTGGPQEAPMLKGYVSGYFEARVDWLLQRVDEGAATASEIASAAHVVTGRTKSLVP